MLHQVRLDAESKVAAEAEAVVDQSRASRLGRFASHLVGVNTAVWLVDTALTLWGTTLWGTRVGACGGSGPESHEALRTTLTTLLEVTCMLIAIGGLADGLTDDVPHQVHGFEMFIFGTFNADPHPGNLIAMEDGRVGLIDYGQCKRLDLAPRRAIADLIIKIADDAPAAEVAAAFRRVGPAACMLIASDDGTTHGPR